MFKRAAKIDSRRFAEKLRRRIAVISKYRDMERIDDVVEIEGILSSFVVRIRPASYAVFTVEFSEELVQDVNLGSLPKNWRNFPAPPRTRQIGDSWINKASSVLLRVPGVIVVHEHNFLINPGHPDFPKLVIGGPVPLDIDSGIFEGWK